MSQNTTLLLDEFLQGYDKRLRPGFGGKRNGRNDSNTSQIRKIDCIGVPWNGS